MKSLKSDDMATTAMQTFREDYEVWQEFLAFTNQAGGVSKECEQVRNRSVWVKTSVKQLVAGAEEYKWQCGDDLKAKLQARARCCCQEIIVEEVIGDMKIGRSLDRHSFSESLRCVTSLPWRMAPCSVAPIGTQFPWMFPFLQR